MTRVFNTVRSIGVMGAALLYVGAVSPALAEPAAEHKAAPASEHHASTEHKPSTASEHHASTEHKPSTASEHAITTEHHSTTTTTGASEHHTTTEKTVEHHTTADGTHQVTEHHAKECKISCVNPHAACTESEKVIETLRMLFDAVHKGDFETLSQYMDDGVTTFDEGTKKLIVGKEAVLADLKKKFETNKALGLESLTIDNPYAKVTGNVAVVTFVAKKVYGGKKPARMESHSTDIFVNEGGKWKKMHYRSNWKKVS